MVSEKSLSQLETPVINVSPFYRAFIEIFLIGILLKIPDGQLKKSASETN